MPDDYMEKKQIVQGALSPAHPKKKWWVILLDILAILVFVLALSISGTVIFVSNYYDEPFYVNGFSMYPTLNSESRYYLSSSDSYREAHWNDGTNKTNDFVDYGWAKSKDGWMKDLHRYDIVVTYYPSDATGTLVHDDADLKIKRLIAFPGETVTLEADPDNAAWGKTTITNSEGTFVLPNLYTMDDYPDLPSGTKYPGINASLFGTWTLGEDEYFVMGDNRASNYSKDSRNIGPIPGHLLRGKAYVITGMRKLIRKEGGSFDLKFSLKYMRMPWAYKSLEYKS